MRSSLVLGGTAAIAVAALFSWSAWQTCGFEGCPAVRRLRTYQPNGASVLLDRGGARLAELIPRSGRLVALASLPSYVPDAFVAIEDQRFYRHVGVDWRRVGGAALANLRARSFEQGFGTISMQLARNVFVEDIPAAERTVGRKLREIRIARAIEREYAKNEILELYLNHIYFGNGARGIEAASQHYFGRSATELTLPQAALLAALPKAPARYDPRRHHDAARARRDLVLAQMERQGRISAAEGKRARESPLRLAPTSPVQREREGAPYFVEQVRRELEQRYGDTIYDETVRVWTTLDARLQGIAGEELERQLAAVEQGAAGVFRGPRYSPSAGVGDSGTRYLQGAVVAVDPRSGDVLAWIGGRDFGQSHFDRVAHARRQVGSAFKPFVYAAALERRMSLSQKLLDEPLTVQLDRKRAWTPRNFGGEYDGSVSLRDALVASKNVATVRLAHEIGYEAAVDVARRAGISEAELDALPSTVLGAAAISPLELTTAYSVFANLGRSVEPRLILRVERADGSLLGETVPRFRHVLDPRIAFLVNDVLAEAVDRGSGAAVRRAGFRGAAAGKTGTTNAGGDGWFIGYFPDLVVGIWIGFDRPRPVSSRATGAQLAAPPWARTMQRYRVGHPPPPPWQPPDGIVVRRVDPQTGLILADGCHSLAGPAEREYFVAGFEPTEYCPGAGEPPRFVLGEHTIRFAGSELDVARVDSESGSETERSSTQATRRTSASSRAGDAPLPAAVEATAAPVRARREQVERGIAAGDRSDLSGEWTLVNRLESSSYAAYEGLELGYRVRFWREGERIRGEGRKWSENGRLLPASRRTLIRFEGRREGNSVMLTFTEVGARRTSGGVFHLRADNADDELRGRFSSSAAASSGRTIAYRSR